MTNPLKDALGAAKGAQEEVEHEDRRHRKNRPPRSALEKIMQEKKMSVRELKNATNLPLHALLRYVKGDAPKKSSRILKIANALGVNQNIVFPRSRTGQAKVKYDRFMKQWSVEEMMSIEVNPTTRLVVQAMKHNEQEDRTLVSIAKFVEYSNGYKGPRGGIGIPTDAVDEIIVGMLRTMDHMGFDGGETLRNVVDQYGKR